jgi:trehalose 6-phosphate phosphatase
MGKKMRKKSTRKKSQTDFKAVIFDLDGVVTKTVLIHIDAWKEVFDEYLRLREQRGQEPFVEFTKGKDYRLYVDGRPRYDGVRTFLDSRGITIPFGNKSDSPEQETVCGLGNKKNAVFLKILEEKGSQVYPTTIEFIKALKKVNVRVGVASSSKNCKHILESAGIDHLFETRVDGVVSEELGLKGKPDGDIFVTASRNLGVLPAEAVVVEDAISGVQAGRNGGFGLVIGVARKDNEEQLLNNGADVVVSDFSQMTVKWVNQWFKRQPRPLFKSWDKEEEIVCSCDEGAINMNPCYGQSARSIFQDRQRIVLFLDYDGTLSPIVSRPELAVISQEMREVVKRLSEKHTVAIVSGRMREDVEKLVGVEGICYAGSHGFDIIMPGHQPMIHPEAEKIIPVIAEVTRRLCQEIGSIKGILIEEKKFSAAVHYRLVKKDKVLKIKKAVNKIMKAYQGLRLMSGKKVFEILPDIDWDKGRAVRCIIEALKISWKDSCVIYIGDDVTDEDAFRAVRVRGTGILVSEKPKASAAGFQLFSTDEVKELLQKVDVSS